MIQFTFVNGVMEQFCFRQDELHVYWTLCVLMGEYKYAGTDAVVKVRVVDDDTRMISASTIRRCDLS